MVWMVQSTLPIDFQRVNPLFIQNITSKFTTNHEEC